MVLMLTRNDGLDLTDLGLVASPGITRRFSYRKTDDRIDPRQTCAADIVSPPQPIPSIPASPMPFALSEIETRPPSNTWLIFDHKSKIANRRLMSLLAESRETGVQGRERGDHRKK